MKGDSFREYFSIPNLMGYFRILLVPVYFFLYLGAESQRDYYMAAGVMLLSFLSDFLDGKIARKFNMVTEFGKILDPIADKITQGALALSFTFRYPAMAVLLLAFCVKEGLLGLAGLFMMRRGYRMGGARFHGKLCTVVLDFVMLLALALPGLPYLAVNLLVCVSVGFMAASLLLYVRLYWKAWRALRFYQKTEGEESEGSETLKKEKERKDSPLKDKGISRKGIAWAGRKRRRWPMALAAAAFLIYLGAGAALPFLEQPQIKESTKEKIEASEFYGEHPCGERARVISDNGEALAERIRLISQAREEIILSTFEFDADTSGKQVIAALMEAAGRGVKVSVLADGFPYLTAMWGNPYFLALAEMENVEIRVYNPVRLWKPWGFMGRLHDKYLIADRTAYILGGRNTYDYFLGNQPGYKNYDWDMLVYSAEAQGESSLEQIREYFRSVWENPRCRTLGKGILWKENPSVKRAGEELRRRFLSMREEHGEWFEREDYRKTTYAADRIRLVSNPTHIYAKEPVVFYSITELMKNAEREVVFHTPYIICNDWMLKRLGEVCDQGKRVMMMTNSVANNGNPFGAMDYRRNKERILDTGVEILEYDGGVSYHGKCFTVDERISGVGSFNWDMRSAYLDTELMLVIDSREVNRQLREEMEKYEGEALRVLNGENSRVPEGLKPQQLTPGRKLQLDMLEVAVGWARFLM